MKLAVLRSALGAWSILSLGLFVTGCGGDEAPAEPTVEVTTGGEAEPEVATGPIQSYVADDHTIVLRLDMARVRESSLREDIGSLVRSYPTWRDLLGNSGIDPVRDFDAVLLAAQGAMNGRSILLVHHHLSNADVREAVLNMAVDRGERPEWRQEGGFDVVDWPVEADPPRVVVLTGEHELVVTTAEDLPRVVQVARDHRLRREADESVEPALALEEGVIATVMASELTEATRRRIQYPPESFELELRDDPENEGRMLIHASAAYADASSAGEARSYLTRMRDQYAGQMLVRAVGLDRPLREAVIAGEAERVDVRANFTEEEAERVMGLLALGQLGGS